MPITRPGDPPADPRFRFVPLILILLLLGGIGAPFIIAHFHDAAIRRNQAHAVDALREFAALQDQRFLAGGEYAGTFAELGGNWKDVQSADSQTPTAFSGYRFKTFRAAAQPGGKTVGAYTDEQGRQTRGYAVIAVPVKYEVTGRYVFFLSGPAAPLNGARQDPRVFYFDFGVRTDESARMFSEYQVPEGAAGL